MAELRHELIRASAGTGKTYQLTNRYLRILFLTGEPEKIIALTFTRKAAGEFFEKIFRRLIDAAESADSAMRLSAELGLSLKPEDCVSALRLLLARLHQLQLSTYDSFFSRVVQTFPFELGLAGTPSLLDEEQQVRAIERAQLALSRRTQEEPEFLTNFWHAVKRATMGVELKSIRDLVTGFIQENHALFFDASEARLWGQEHEIWPGGSPWHSEEIDWAGAGRSLEESLNWTDISAPQAQFWRELIQELDTWRPPIELPLRIEYFLPRILQNFANLGTGHVEIQVNRKAFRVEAMVGDKLKTLGRALYWSMVQPRLEATQGIFDLVRHFEDVYHREVRLLGHLTLDDATRFLGGTAAFGRGLGDRDLRAQLGYRLDGAFDHWLLDEFQDTSRLQWKAIADLIEEVLSDPERRRSFFAVGDAKQSLYGWRGSDDALFDQLQQKYGEVLDVRPMNQSFRSAPAVLSLANAVFGQTEAIAELFTPALAKRWAAMWQEHVSAPSVSSVSGYACVLHSPEGDKTNFETVLRLLQQLKPIERGLSVAVLTQKNATADALVEYLRAHDGPPASLAANVRPGSDNAVAAGLRSFLSVAAHPQDTLAWQHLRMTPLGPLLQKEFATSARLSARLRQIWSEHGLCGLVDEWARRCHAILDTSDTFNRGRIDLCRAAAAAAEEQRGERDIDMFVRQLAGLLLREHDNPGQVAVMTVHKAKGLDWDLVILTDLEGNTLMERRGGLEVHRNLAGEIAWILDMPSAELAEFDSALAERIRMSKEASAFERLCVLYVGLTRAKTALYVVTHPAKGTSKNFPRLFADTLGGEPLPTKIGEEEFICAWQSGDPAWMTRRTAPRPSPVMPASIQALPAEERAISAQAAPLQPSAEKAREIRGDVLLTQDRSQRDLGTELHAALSQIEWSDQSTRLPLEQSDSSESNDENAASGVSLLSEEAQKALAAIFADAATRRLFVLPSVPTKLWREMPFEILIDQHWISGRFDRVVVTLDPSGRPIAAHIIDFKVIGSLRDPSAFREQHSGQMKTYREVAARLWRLPATAVKTTLVAISTQGTSTSTVLDV